MKNLTIFIFISFCMAYTGKAQTSEFAPLGATWNYKQNLSFSPPVHNIFYHLANDTLVGDLNCRKIEITSKAIGSEVENKDEYFLIYEEEGAVYIVDTTSHELYNYFNFNYTAGDTANTLVILISDDPGPSALYDSSVITSVYDTIIEDNVFKVFLLENFGNLTGFYERTFTNKFIEGIGSTGTFFPMYYSPLYDDARVGELRCYEDSLLGLVKFVDEECELTVSIGEQIQSDQFTIYPNPTTDYIYVEGNNINTYVIQIYSVDGKLIEFKNNLINNNNKMEIDINHLSEGMYWIKLTGTNYSYTSQFTKVN